MTAFGRFDPFEQRISASLEEIAPARAPDYLDDVLRRTGRTSQRPRWSFPERWIPMDVPIVRVGSGGRFPARVLLVVVLIALLLAAAAAVYVGSRNRLPAPYGPARNGQIAYGDGGDLYVRDSLTGEPRLLVGGPGTQAGAAFSPNGALVAYAESVSGVDHVVVADAAGRSPRTVLDTAFVDGTASWSPDSRSLALTSYEGGFYRLWIAPADGSGAREVEVDGHQVRDAQYNPAGDGTLLVRLEDGAGKVELALINLTGKIVRAYDLPGEMVYGAKWELSGSTFSPDGRTIAYNSVERSGEAVHFLTYLVDVDGSNRRRLPGPTGDDYSQAWPIYSPDGRWIALETWVGKPGGPAVNQLRVVAADGSGPSRPLGPSLPNQSLVKSWSPDGTRIFLSASASDASTVYAIDPVSGQAEELSWAHELPDWQRVAP